MTERDIFDQLLEIESREERTAFLDEACGDDNELRTRVEELLRSHDDAGSFLERPALEPSPTLLDEGSTEDATRVGVTNPDGAIEDDTGDEVVEPPPVDVHQQTALFEPAEDLGLDFLQPTDKPDRIGMLGPYEIIEVLGRGGMGVVLKAHDPALNRIVAIKTLAPDYANNPTARKRFAREAQAAAAVAHNHVVTIHAVEPSGKVPYLVMECVQGQSLREKLDKVGALEVREILRIGSQIAQGLAAAHDQGLIHRDVKPGNVLLENGVERVKLTDFGLARATDDVAITRTGDIAGTPQFMSPEQAEGRAVDVRSDLFSLGSVLYAMCTGRPPFRGDTAIAVLRKVCDDEPRPIRDVNPDIPPWLVDIIDHLLAKDPEHRIQTAEEVARILNEHLAELQNPSSGTVKPKFERRLPKPTRGGRWLPWIVAACALCGSFVVSEWTGNTRVTAPLQRYVRNQGLLELEVNAASIDQIDAIRIQGHDILADDSRYEIVKTYLPEHRVEKWYVTLHAGEYRIAVEYDGREVADERVEITRNGTTRMQVPGTIVVPPPERDAPAESPIGAEWQRLAGRWQGVSGAQDGRVLDPREAAGNGLVVDAEKRTMAFHDVGEPGKSKVELDPTQTPKRIDVSILGPRPETMFGIYKLEGDELTIRLSQEARRPRNFAANPDPRMGSEFLMVFRRVDSDPDATEFYRGLRGDGLATLVRGVVAESKPSRILRETVSNASDPPRFVAHIATTGGLITELVTNALQERAEDRGLTIDVEDLGRPTAIQSFRYSSRRREGRVTVTVVTRDDEHVEDTRNLALAVTVEEWSKGERQPEEWTEIDLLLAQRDGEDVLTLPGLTTADRFEILTRLNVLAARNPGLVVNVDLAEGVDQPFVELDELRKGIEAIGATMRPGPQLGANEITLLAKLEGATDAFWVFAYSPDGRFVFAASGDKWLYQWDVTTHEIVRRVELPDFPRSLVVHPDGEHIFTGLYKGGLVQWSLTDWKPVRQFEGHTQEVMGLALSPDNRRLLSSDTNGLVRLWDVASGEVRHEFEADGYSRVAAFSPDGRLAFHAAGKDVRLWELETGRTIRLVGEPDPSWLHVAAFSPDGRRLATGDVDGTIEVWNVETGNRIARAKVHDTSVRSLDFTTDGRHIVSGSRDKSLRVLHADDLRAVAVKRTETLCTTYVAVAPDGRTVASAGGWTNEDVDGVRKAVRDGDFDVRLWRLPESVWPDPNEFRLVRTLSGPKGPTKELAVSSDGRFAASVSGVPDELADNTIRYWDLETGRELWSRDLGASLLAVDLSPDGRLVAVASRGKDEAVHVLRTDTGELESKIEEDADVQNLAFSPDGEHLLTAGNGVMRLWNGTELVREFPAPGNRFRDLEFLPDGERFAAATVGSSLMIWKTATAELVRTIETEHTALEAVAISPDGETLVSGGIGGVLQLWDVESGEERDRWGRPSGLRTYSLAFTPDGRHVLRGTNRGELSIWRRGTEEPVASLDSPSGSVWSIALSPDGKRVLVAGGTIQGKDGIEASGDYALRLWRLPESVWPKDGFALDRKLPGHAAPVWDSRFLPGSSDRLLSVDQGGKVLEWDLAEGKSRERFDVGWSSDAVFSADVKWLAVSVNSGDRKGQVAIWDVEKGERRHTLQHGLDWTEVLRFSPDGKTLLAAGSPDVAVLWNVATGEERRRIDTKGGGKLSTAAFTADGRWLALGKTRALYLYDLRQDRNRDLFLPQNRGQKAIVSAAEGTRIAVLQSGGHIAVLDAATGDVLHEYRDGTEDDDAVVSAAFVGNDRFLITASELGRITIREMETGRVVATAGTDPGSYRTMTASPDGRRLVTAGGLIWNEAENELEPNGDNALRLWPLPESVWPKSPVAVRRFEGHDGFVDGLAFARGGELAVSVGADGSVRLWDVATGRSVAKLDVGELGAVASNKDGSRIAVGTTDGSIAVIDPGTHQVDQRGKRGTRILSLAFRPGDSGELLVGDFNGAAVWDTTNGGEIRKLLDGETAVERVAFSRDGKVAMGAGYDGTIRLWNPATWESIREIPDADRKAALSHDGRLVAIRDRLFDVGTGEVVRRLENDGNVLDLAFTPDDRHVALCVGGRKLVVCEVATGRVVTSVESDVPDVQECAVSPDGRHVLTGGGWRWDPEAKATVSTGDHDVRLWRLPERVWPASPFPVGSMPYVLTSDEYAWTDPVNLGVNGPEADVCPWVSSDGLTLLFSSKREGGQGDFDVWQSTRGGVAENWSEPVNLGPTINSRGSETNARLTSDGLVLVFLSTLREGAHQGGMDIWTATRESVDDPWQAPVNAGRSVNGASHEAPVFLSDDRRMLVFVSDRTGNWEKLVSVRNKADDAWSAPRMFTDASDPDGKFPGLQHGVLLGHRNNVSIDLFRWDAVQSEWEGLGLVGPPINGDHRDTLPHFDTATNTLYFASTRPGGKGETDVWTARRVRKGESPFPVGSMPYVLTSDEYAWTEPVPVAGLNSEDDEGQIWMAEDGLTVLFSSRRAGGSGNPDLWQSHRERIDGAWSPPINLGPPVNSRWFDAHPWMSRDGLTLVFTSTRPGGQGGQDLWITTRESVDDLWSEPVNLGDRVNTAHGETAGYLSDDGRRLVFYSNRGVVYEHWFTTRESLDAEWSLPQRVIAGNDEVLDGHPQFDAGRMLWHDNEKTVGLEHWDAGERRWMHTPFGPTINVGDQNAWPSFHRGTNTLYWRSERPGGPGAKDLWMSRRVRRDAVPELDVEAMSALLSRWIDHLGGEEWQARKPFGDLNDADAKVMAELVRADRRTMMQVALDAGKKLGESPVAMQRLRKLFTDFGVDPPKEDEPELMIGGFLQLLRDLGPPRKEDE